MSEKAIKLINDLRRDIWIDVMFTPEKNAEDDSLKALMDYIAELEAAQRWIPVSERLPKDLQSVVIITNDSMTGIVRYLELYGREGFGAWSEDVTHWMSLPESPNDTQTETFVYGKERER